MRFHVLTLFPEMLEQGLYQSILGRAAQRGQLSFHMVNIRDYTNDRHGKVDDYPYGGGAGMLMQAQPVYDAYLSVAADIAGMRDREQSAGAGKPNRRIRTIYMTPQGRTFTQRLARELAREEDLVFLCGHYEGIDERVLEEIVTDYVSLGDYVLTGGELPAMVMIDAIARLVPGVLHNGESAENESFRGSLLEYPQYSRPEVWRGKSVPEVLLSGNHRNIQAWRLERSLERTRQRRPDLYDQYLTRQDFIRELAKQKRKYIHLMELLTRDMAYEVCRGEKSLLLKVENTQTYALYAESFQEAQQLLEQWGEEWTQEPETMKILVCQESARDILTNRYGLTVGGACRQACYTRREPLRVQHRDIRSLTADDLEHVARRYPACERNYLRQRILAGTMYGVYMSGGDTLPAGFIGIHEDGSMGMLYVDEAYRRQGLAFSLEAWLVNWHLKRGETPYCRVAEENLAALNLQEKLGLCLCVESMWWLERKQNANFLQKSLA